MRVCQNIITPTDVFCHETFFFLYSASFFLACSQNTIGSKNIIDRTKIRQVMVRVIRCQHSKCTVVLCLVCNRNTRNEIYTAAVHRNILPRKSASPPSSVCISPQTAYQWVYISMLITRTAYRYLVSDTTLFEHSVAFDYSPQSYTLWLYANSCARYPSVACDEHRTVWARY